MAKSTGRSTDTVGVEAEPRERRFMRSALAILGETGRTDFTVLEVVERSKTSLRSFYQHFSTKDELLLALIDKIMSESTRVWREDTSPIVWELSEFAAPNWSQECWQAARPSDEPIYLTERVGRRESRRKAA